MFGGAQSTVMGWWIIVVGYELGEGRYSIGMLQFLPIRMLISDIGNLVNSLCQCRQEELQKCIQKDDGIPSIAKGANFVQLLVKDAKCAVGQNE